MSIPLDEPTEVAVPAEPAEPPITMIASYLSARLPTEGVERKEAKEAWRATLRYARSSGAMEALADKIIEETHGDRLMRRICEVLRT
jgi:hypothetical protein